MISVVIPTFARPDLLTRLLHSIAQQTKPAFEVIIVDDASPQQEEYAQVIASFQARIHGLQYLRLDKNAGAPHARNVGIQLATGAWVALVDDDDEWLPQKLAKQGEIIQYCDDHVGIVYAWANTINADGSLGYRYNSLICGFALKQILKGCFICSPTVIVRKKTILSVGMFDEHMTSCQDWDMWTRILAQGYSCQVLPEVVALYHKHDQASIGLSLNAQKGYKRFYAKHWHLGLQQGNLRFIIRSLRYFLKDH